MKRASLRLFLSILSLMAVACGGSYQTVADVPPPSPKIADLVYEPRPGFVRIDGHYVRSNDGWTWSSGSWVAERPGYIYRQGSWTSRGAKWHWRAGEWERVREGHVRVSEHWELRGGELQFVPGYWQATRPGMTWSPGHWRRHGRTHIWSLGRFVPDGEQTANATK